MIITEKPPTATGKQSAGSSSRFSIRSLTLLQFFLNHRRYLRSEDSKRAGTSPAELLTSEKQAHWLEPLGYTRFSRS
jgi:hypothetical protein